MRFECFFISLLIPFLFQCSKNITDPTYPSCYSDELVNAFNDTSRNYISIQKLSTKPQANYCTIIDISINGKSIGVPSNQDSYLGLNGCCLDNIYDEYYNTIIHINDYTDLLEITYNIMLKGTITGIDLESLGYSDSSFGMKNGGGNFFDLTDFNLLGTSNSNIKFKVRFFENNIWRKNQHLVRASSGDISSSPLIDCSSLKLHLNTLPDYGDTFFPRLRIIQKHGDLKCYPVYSFSWSNP